MNTAQITNDHDLAICFNHQHDQLKKADYYTYWNYILMSRLASTAMKGSYITIEDLVSSLNKSGYYLYSTFGNVAGFVSLRIQPSVFK